MIELMKLKLYIHNGHSIAQMLLNYRKVSNISRTFVGNKILDYSDVDEASPVDAAPTSSLFST